MTAAALNGRRVLVPRASAADPLALAVRAAGGEPVPAALTRTVGVPDPDELDAELGVLRRGAYAWLAVTSATTVGVLAERAAHLGVPLADLAARCRVAAVGPATAAALRHHGVRVDLLPDGESSAAALVAAWPSGDGDVLLPRSAIAAPTLAAGLRGAGWRVRDVDAYTTVTGEREPAVASDLASGALDVVLLTSTSTGRALVELYGVPGPAVRVCAIGETTARAAREAGLTVHAVARRQSPDGLVAAAATALAPAPSEPALDPAPPAPALVPIPPEPAPAPPDRSPHRSETAR
ncbi:uroporphyrinogen-III synthase [Georgenia wangjunii]|uniref:uroporphyrinogen-III synthase n=1 Tax=Georgenia wangjunii TaxID=3117730 RepID=UPI002F265A27